MDAKPSGAQLPLYLDIPRDKTFFKKEVLTIGARIPSSRSYLSNLQATIVGVCVFVDARRLACSCREFHGKLCSRKEYLSVCMQRENK